jgi:hypothetical protein
MNDSSSIRIFVFEDQTMFVADTINFREIVMKEPLPLATIQNAVIDFVRGRDDVVLFGAQAVNVYVSEPRATQEVDLMSTRAAGVSRTQT